MKYVIGVFMQLVCSVSFGFDHVETLTELKNVEIEKSVLNDSMKVLVIKKGDRKIIVEDGDRITVRVDEKRYRGRCLIQNDSIIYIDSTSIYLADIDMVAKSNAGKVFLLIFASTPIVSIGTVSILDGHISKYMPHVWVGSVFLGVAAGGVTIEGLSGKRYRRYKKFGRQDGSIHYKWTYSIQ